MLLNEKLNYTAVGRSITHVQIRENSMTTTVSTKRPFGIFSGEKPKIIGSFSEFVLIA